MAEKFSKDLQNQAACYLGDSKYCIGYHLRYAFDTLGPSVRLVSSSQADAVGIRDFTKNAGLQTLNHVIDSIKYQFASRRTEFVALRVSFVEEWFKLPHTFDELSADQIKASE